MNYRSLGCSGLKVSEFAYGTMMIHDGVTERSIIRKAFDAGINFFDTADAYGEKAEVETLLGQLIQELPRDEYVLATKVRWGYGAQGVNNSGLSAKHIAHAVEGSLKRLKVDFIDLYQFHSPTPDVPVEESVEMMGRIIRQGKVIYWGISNYNGAQTMRVIRACDQLGVPYPVSNQVGHSVFNPGMVESVGKLVTGLDTIAPLVRMGLIIFSPLDGGLLTGKYSQGIPKGSRLERNAQMNPRWKRDMLRPEKLEAVERLVPIAQRLEISLAQLALAWLLHQNNISSVIVGATTFEQLKENMAAGQVKLGQAVLQEIEEVRKTFKAKRTFEESTL